MNTKTEKHVVLTCNNCGCEVPCEFLTPGAGPVRSIQIPSYCSWKTLVVDGKQHVLICDACTEAWEALP